MSYVVKINGKITPETINKLNEVADVGEVVSNFELIYIEADEDQLKKVKEFDFVEKVTKLK